MIQALLNIFKIPELRNKILFTLGALAVFRIGHWIPLPGINQEALAKSFEASRESSSTFSDVANVISMFSGGAFSHSTIFGLGVMPYITAGIIFQLLTAVLPALKKLQEEGPTGRQKIQEWTRYATIALSVIQGFGWLQFLKAGQAGSLIYANWVDNPLWWIMAITALTAGTMFLMWLGEQIDKHGIGNGVSMIIMAGILTQMPLAITEVAKNFDPSDPDAYGYLSVIALFAGFLAVVGGAVLMTVAQRRIPVQQAKHTRGRRVFGGQKSYLPLRINHSGVMPVVFASSLMIFPSILLSIAVQQASALAPDGGVVEGFRWLETQLSYGNFLYVIGEVILIYFFSYFWITVQFNPEEMAKQLRDHGSFIPGLRPGPRTAEYLESVMERITYVGAAFLATLAILPMIISSTMGIPQYVTQFLGGTGLLIVVSVVLDFMQRVEANLLMRNYAGFLSGDDGRGPRLQSSRSL